jgi:hypothetical protein
LFAIITVEQAPPYFEPQNPYSFVILSGAKDLYSSRSELALTMLPIITVEQALPYFELPSSAISLPPPSKN